MNPDQTIRTAVAGRRAAAIRDGRAEAGDATTQVIAPQHTPGPWAVHPGLAQVDAFAPTAQPICRLLWPTDARSEAETEANAHLIAASPKLLALCRKAAEVIAGIPNANAAARVLAEQLREVVAEAEGRR